jgi:hypothetical protein
MRFDQRSDQKVQLPVWVHRSWLLIGEFNECEFSAKALALYHSMRILQYGDVLLCHYLEIGIQADANPYSECDITVTANTDSQHPNFVNGF